MATHRIRDLVPYQGQIVVRDEDLPEVRRISVEKLLAIYAIQHPRRFAEAVASAARVTVSDMLEVPDSTDMSFGDFFEACRSQFDIFEERTA